MKKFLTFGILFLTFSYHIFAQTPWQNYMSELKKKSDSGDVEALGMLGVSKFWDQMHQSEESNEIKILLAKASEKGSCIGAYYYTRFILRENKNPDPKLIKLAEGGNEVAQFVYSRILVGNNDGKETKDSKSYLEKSAAKGYAPASFVLYNISDKKDSSSHLLEKLANEGFTSGKFLYAANLLGTNPKEGFKIIQELANSGDLKSIQLMKTTYAKGEPKLGIQANSEKANYWMMKEVNLQSESIVKTYLLITTDNDPIMSGAPSKNDILQSIIADLRVIYRDSNLKLNEIVLKRGDKLQSNGINGVPKGTELYPVKFTPIIKDNPMSVETIYYFYKNEFSEWKFFSQK